MAKPLSFRWDEAFIARIDEARKTPSGSISRSAFVRAAVEQALAVKPDLAGEGSAPPESRARTSRYPSAPAERPIRGTGPQPKGKR